MITHLSAKQSEDGHHPFPLAFLLCSALPVVLGRGVGEEGRRLCFLFTYPTLIHLVWTLGSEGLSFSGDGGEDSSGPLLHHLVSLSQSKGSDQGCPTVLSWSSTAPQHHSPTMNETTNCAACGNQLHCEVCGHSKQLSLHGL